MFLHFDSDSKFFSLELLFTFCFTIFPFLFRITFFYYIEYIYIFFSLSMSLFLASTRTSNPPLLPPFVRGALYLSVPWYQYL